jgi:hypothetical protein
MARCLPTAGAVGFIPSPLRGWGVASLKGRGSFLRGLPGTYVPGYRMPPLPGFYPNATDGSVRTT